MINDRYPYRDVTEPDTPATEDLSAALRASLGKRDADKDDDER
jgi:hypothetical protein